MPYSRARRTSSLIEVARILVQQGRQYGTTDHDVRKTISRSYAEALTIGTPTLTELGTISLIEVARILVQQGRQYGTTDHDVRKTISRSYAEALTIGTPTLTELGTICRLPNAGYCRNPCSGNWVRRQL